jgi:hypothetical protein
MKLRIKDNSIRIRLNQTEALSVARGESVMKNTVFSPVSSVSYSLVPWQLDVFNASFEGNNLTVNIPLSKTEHWMDSEETGFEFRQNNGEEGGLLIVVEKDFACLKPRDGEDESDHFPHPEEGKIKC